MSKLPFASLLQQAAALKRDLTDETHLIALEKQLRSTLRPIDLGRPEILDERCAGIGLYYLEARFPFHTLDELEEFGTKWGRIRAPNNPPAMPRYYASRASNHTGRIGAGDYIPFYLGKRTDLKDRLSQHIFGKATSKTYSLKLQSRPAVIADVEFRFGFLPIPVHEDGYFCVGLLEHALRDRINPIIGKQ